MKNSRQRLERIETGLAAMPCPMCGQMPQTNHTADELREKAQDLLQRLQDEAGMDEQTALAALREKAPTLSSYLR